MDQYLKMVRRRSMQMELRNIVQFIDPRKEIASFYRGRNYECHLKRYRPWRTKRTLPFRPCRCRNFPECGPNKSPRNPNLPPGILRPGPSGYPVSHPTPYRPYYDGASNQTYVYNMEVDQGNQHNNNLPFPIENQDQRCQTYMEAGRLFHNCCSSSSRSSGAKFHFPDCPQSMCNVSRPSFCNLAKNHMPHTCCNHSSLHMVNNEQYCTCHLENVSKKKSGNNKKSSSSEFSLLSDSRQSIKRKKYEHKFERKTKVYNDRRYKTRRSLQSVENKNLTIRDSDLVPRSIDRVVEMALMPQCVPEEIQNTECLPPYEVGNTLNCIRCGDIVTSRSPRCYRCCARIPPLLMEVQGATGAIEEDKCGEDKKYENCTLCNEKELIKLIADHQHPGEDPSRRQKREIYITRLTCDSCQCMKRKLENKVCEDDTIKVPKCEDCTKERCYWLQYHQAEIEKLKNEERQKADHNLKFRSLSDSSLTNWSYHAKFNKDFLLNSKENSYKPGQTLKTQKILQNKEKRQKCYKTKYSTMKTNDFPKQKVPNNKQKIKNLLRIKKSRKTSPSTEQVTTFDFDEFADPPRETITTCVKKKIPPGWAKTIVFPDCPEDESLIEDKIFCSKEMITTFDIDDSVHPPKEIITTTLVNKQTKVSTCLDDDEDSLSTVTTKSQTVVQEKHLKCETFTNTPSVGIDYKSNSFVNNFFNKIKNLRICDNITNGHKLKKLAETEECESNKSSNQLMALPSNCVLHSENCCLEMGSVQKIDLAPPSKSDSHCKLKKSLEPPKILEIQEGKMKLPPKTVLLSKSTPIIKPDNSDLPTDKKNVGAIGLAEQESKTTVKKRNGSATYGTEEDTIPTDKEKNVAPTTRTEKETMPTDKEKIDATNGRTERQAMPTDKENNYPTNGRTEQETMPTDKEKNDATNGRTERQAMPTDKEKNVAATGTTEQEQNDKSKILQQIDWSKCPSKKPSVDVLYETQSTQTDQKVGERKNPEKENPKTLDEKEIEKLVNPLIYNSELGMRPLTCDEFFQEKCHCKSRGRGKKDKKLFTIELCPHGSSCNIKPIDDHDDHFIRGQSDKMRFHCDDITKHNLLKCDKCSTAGVYCKPGQCENYDLRTGRSNTRMGPPANYPPAPISYPPPPPQSFPAPPTEPIHYEGPTLPDQSQVQRRPSPARTPTRIPDDSTPHPLKRSVTYLNDMPPPDNPPPCPTTTTSGVNYEETKDDKDKKGIGWLYQTPLGFFSNYSTLYEPSDKPPPNEIYFKSLDPTSALTILEDYSLNKNKRSPSPEPQSKQSQLTTFIYDMPSIDYSRASRASTTYDTGLNDEDLAQNEEELDDIFPGITQQLTSNVTVDLVPMLTKLLGIPYDERQPLPEDEKAKKKKDKHGCHKDDDDSDASSECSCIAPCCDCGKLTTQPVPPPGEYFRVEDLTEQQLRELRILEGNIDSDLRELDHASDVKKTTAIDLKIMVAKEKLALLEEEKRLKVKKFGFAGLAPREAKESSKDPKGKSASPGSTKDEKEDQEQKPFKIGKKKKQGKSSIVSGETVSNKSFKSAVIEDTKNKEKKESKKK